MRTFCVMRWHCQLLDGVLWLGMCNDVSVGASAGAGRDLRAIFALLRAEGSEGGGSVPSHAVPLLRALAVMARHAGPSTFFDHANEAAGIVRNTPLKFPGARHGHLSTSD